MENLEDEAAPAKPILFSAQMVRAILSGTKTQTRRILKPQPEWRANNTWMWMYSKYSGSGSINPHEPGPDWVTRQRWAPGDTLWVRETWAQNPDHPGVCYNSAVCYRADAGHDYDIPKWRSSIHMPRWVSRITLRVTDVRVHRLRDISEADAEAEGAPPILVLPDGGSEPHIEGFRGIWEHINGAGSWEANPWVAAVTFERIMP